MPQLLRAEGSIDRLGARVATTAAAGGAGVLIAVTSGRAQLLVVVALAAMLALTVASIFARRLPAIFLSLVWALLVAYALLGRGAAYAGYPPIFAGELVLAFGALALLVGNGLALARSAVAWLLGAFMAWGAVCTVPHVGTYGMNALRDAVLWGYGAFALLVGSYLLTTGALARVPSRYGVLAAILPAFMVGAWAADRIGGTALPSWPGSGMQLVVFKPGDAAVHLGGALAFVLLGLHRAPSAARAPDGWTRWLWWTGWVAAAAIASAASRAALLAIVAAAGVVLAVRPRGAAIWRPVVVVLAAVLALVVSGVSIKVRDGRSLSAKQLVENIGSITADRSAPGDLGSTREWRLQWWRDIVGYTVHGPYFWRGKGFGINLADADGYQVDVVRKSLRSPHNSHLTILARSGVPGLVLWGLFQAAFALSLVRSYIRLRRAHDWWARVHLWVLAYWLAFVVNAGFDVFLEGPQGGIWFWSVVGLGLACIEGAKRLGGGAATGAHAGGAA